MNQTLEFFASKGYGVFPYIIIREMGGMYLQIPIHFSIQELLLGEGVLVNQLDDESDNTVEKNCIDALKRIIRSEPVITNKRDAKENWIFSDNRKIEGCVVFSSKSATYLDKDGNVKEESESIPWGGTLISICGETINVGDRHFNFLKE